MFVEVADDKPHCFLHTLGNLGINLLIDSLIAFTLKIRVAKFQ